MGTDSRNYVTTIGSIMKIGDFVKPTSVYITIYIGRITALDGSTFEVKWNNGQATRSHWEHQITPMTLSEEEKMLWILENE